MGPPSVPIFDGHNDSLLRLYMRCEGSPGAFLEGQPEGAEAKLRGHLDLPRARAGGLRGGFFAVFVPPLGDLDIDLGAEPPRGIDQPVSQEPALKVTVEMIALYHRLLRASGGALRPILGRDDLEVDTATLQTLLHLEGAEAIDENLANLEALFAAGLRSVGPVWSRPNAFGHGVPFRFPSGPDTGPGLTHAGKQLVRACRDLGILVDLAHLNEKGFWDVTQLTDDPLVVTHTAAHALAPSSRNLTDDQMRAVRDSGGVVGLTFHCGDLRAEGKIRRGIPLSRMAEHLEHMAEVMSVDHVALGSDFDGALMPRELPDAASLQRLPALLLDRGWDLGEVERICAGNWARVLELSLPA